MGSENDTRPGLLARERRAGPTPKISQPCPEDVLLSWLMWLPEGTDHAQAARKEIAKLETKGPLPQNLQRLRDLLLEISAR
jgi:hypothetical protein